MDKHLILHLTLIEDIGPGAIQRIMLLLRQGFEGHKRSGVNGSDLYAFATSDWMHVFGFSEITAQKIATGLADKKLLERELSLIEEYNINWLTITDESYPKLLREIYLPPAVLYWQGSSSWDVSAVALAKADKRVAIVGARKANDYGQRAVNTIVPDLVAAGYTIVSGGAVGIDAMAHKATLQCGGKTIAILGSGLLRPYPSANKKLFTAIVDSGGIVASSFPLTMEGLPGNFPARNRIVTGLSRGCLVVQAAQKSGALISAHYAMEQGREVFAVPGSIGDELSAGCNALIQEGAKLIMNSADILSEFGDRVILPDLRSFNEVGTDKQVLVQQALFVTDSSAPLIHSSSPQLRSSTPGSPCEMKWNMGLKKYSAAQKHILRVCKQPSSVDDIVNTTQLSFGQVQSELFNLQFDGVISQDFTGMWVAIR